MIWMVSNCYCNCQNSSFLTLHKFFETIKLNMHTHYTFVLHCKPYLLRTSICCLFAVFGGIKSNFYVHFFIQCFHIFVPTKLLAQCISKCTYKRGYNDTYSFRFIHGTICDSFVNKMQNMTQSRTPLFYSKYTKYVLKNCGILFGHNGSIIWGKLYESYIDELIRNNEQWNDFLANDCFCIRDAWCA